MIKGARDVGLKSVLMSSESGVGTSFRLLSSWPLTSEVNRQAQVSINYNLHSHTLNQSIINVSRQFLLGYLPWDESSPS